MTESYEDYEREYNASLSRIRSFLAAGTRSLETLRECERLLGQARKHATALQGLAEVEGNPLKIREASQKIERDVQPLAREVERALGRESSGGDASGRAGSGDREELFYQAPSLDGSGLPVSADMEALIGSSEDMLRESLSLTMETERIGNSTITQMYHQREQLRGASTNLVRTRELVHQAGLVLTEIGRKAFYNKIFLYAALGTLGLLNLWALVRLLNKH